MTEAQTTDLAPMIGAGIEVYTKWSDVVATIRSTFDRLYRTGALAPGHGHNFILYSNETKEGGTLMVGVLDRQPGGADLDVKPVHVPGGRVITAPHWGDYERMRETYDVPHAAIAARGLRPIPMSLEVYGDWSEDPAKVRTDLSLHLAIAICESSHYRTVSWQVAHN